MSCWLEQILWLFTLSMPVACITWTITHEEIFREPREFCIKSSKENKSLLLRKFFYLFTCEYCFSHYIAAIIIIFTHYHLLYDDWRGYFISGFSLVWIANFYMSLFALLRMGIKKEKTDIAATEEIIEK